MHPKEYICLMAKYNQVMNHRIYEASERLTEFQLNQKRGAFFGSVFGTLNHIAVGDIVWLKRLSVQFQENMALSYVRDLPRPESLDAILCSSLDELKSLRFHLDESLLNFANTITETDLSQCVSYKSMKGETFSKNLFGLLMHVFNHQTHHRGQVTTLLSQFGIDNGVTDLVTFIPNE